MNRFLLIMVTIGLFVPSVFAEIRGSGMGRVRYGYDLGTYGDPELQLSQDQAAKVRILQLNYLKKIRILQRELMIKRAELKVMDPSSAEDTPKLNRQRREIQELREKLREIWFNYKIESRSLLTFERLEQLGPMENGRIHRTGIGWGNR